MVRKFTLLALVDQSGPGGRRVRKGETSQTERAAADERIRLGWAEEVVAAPVPAVAPVSSEPKGKK